jgi:aryl-alcohol dehydrogenase-like predicted oxidoreductase/enamine deaminase RidA (YjgF/YER057c/UK114 family)
MEKYCQLTPEFKISKVLTGLWQIADLERNGDILEPVATSAFMDPYVKSGFTSFDMADHYGSAEIIAGTFKKRNTSPYPVQLLTKWVPPPGKVTKAIVKDAVELALERMQLDSLDMLQYHCWNYCDPIWLDTLFWLEELKEDGFICNIGLTNFDAEHLRIAAASGINILTNQISFSLIDQRAAAEMIEVCQLYNVKILAFGTLAGGFLSERWMDKPEPKSNELQTWSQMKYKRFIDTAGGWHMLQNILKVLHAIASKHNASIANITSAFMLQYPHVAGIILGARLGVSQHVAENLKIHKIQLSDSEIEEINSVISQFNKIPGGCGDEYRKPPFLTASGDLSHHLDAIPNVYEAIESKNGKLKINSGTSWESMAGYSRAVKSGNSIKVSGTTATHNNKVIGGNDPAAQTHFILDKIEAAVVSLGGKLEDIDRTRIFVKNIGDWEPIALAHGQRFNGIMPANTLVQANLVGEEYLVEIEAEATIE